MLEVQWDPVAAAQAQAWAERCINVHGPDVRNSTSMHAVQLDLFGRTLGMKRFVLL